MFVVAGTSQAKYAIKKMSYARVALDRLYLDYKEFFTNHTTVSDMSKAEYENQILAILEKNTANMSNEELCFYMNEMVIYSLKEAMRDGNNRVKRIR